MMIIMIAAYCTCEVSPVSRRIRSVSQMFTVR
jgi:hypothetical protein